jgi:hypothetical protein
VTSLKVNSKLDRFTKHFVYFYVKEQSSFLELGFFEIFNKFGYSFYLNFALTKFSK